MRLSRAALKPIITSLLRITHPYVCVAFHVSLRTSMLNFSRSKDIIKWKRIISTNLRAIWFTIFACTYLESLEMDQLDTIFRRICVYTSDISSLSECIYISIYRKIKLSSTALSNNNRLRIEIVKVIKKYVYFPLNNIVFDFNVMHLPSGIIHYFYELWIILIDDTVTVSLSLQRHAAIEAVKMSSHALSTD